ncbi:MAG: hypothetical protein H8E55_43825, partial [Pelagibacterales bacterium]|nr:hypothetical protein [Pelagibacterales bacterium]
KIFEKLYLKTASGTEMDNYDYYNLMYNRITEEERTKWIIENMPDA